MSRTIILATGQKGPKGDTGGVDSVNGETGVVILDAVDVGADPAGTAAVAILAHSADTTNVHGIADTSLLLTSLTKLDDMGAPDDNTDLNASTTAHGLAPKRSGVSSEYLSGTGVYSTPAGGGGGGGSGDLLASNNLSDVASASASRTNLGLGSAATAATSAFDAAGSAAAAQAAAILASQPHDVDLDVLAATANTGYGRSLLGLANSAALRVAGGLVLGTDVMAVGAAAGGALSGTYPNPTLAVGLNTLDGLTDVNTAGVATGQVLTYDGAAYVMDDIVIDLHSALTVTPAVGDFVVGSDSSDSDANAKFSIQTILDLAGSSATNLGYTAAVGNGVVTSDTGTDATLLAADGTNAGLMLPAGFTKLAGIATGAEVNDSAAQILTKLLTVDGASSGLDADTLDGTSSAGFATAAHNHTGTYQPLATVLTNTTASFLTADETKLDGIEALADVTDAANVASAGAVMNTGNETVAGIKTFSSSPVVPAPTTDLQAATKKYVDDEVGGVSGATNLSYTAFTTHGIVSSDTGTDATITLSDGTNSGLMTSGNFTKLAAIEAAADVTDAANVNAAGAVMESDYNANTVLAATADNTPAALTVGASTFLGRKATGDISAMSTTEARTLLNVADGSVAGIRVEDEGTSTVATAIALNFAGAGVAVTDAGSGEALVTIAGGGGGAVATDTIFDAKGDLAVGTGADTAAKLTVGTNGTMLVADSTQTTGQLWRTIGFTRKTGATEYFLPEGITATAFASSADRLYYFPLYVHNDYTIDRLSVAVTTFAASSSARLGLYTNANGRPVTNLQDTGAAAIATTANGDPECTVSWAVTAGVGLYWLACVFQGGTPTIRAMTYTPQAAACVGSATVAAWGGIWYQGSVSGALPGTATPLTNGSVLSAPRITVRVT